MEFHFRNVNDAFRTLVGVFHTGEYTTVDGHGTYTTPLKRGPSRYGEVLAIEGPVLVTYTHPTERVLLNTARAVNPFFHLYEALWMLAGRNDVAPLVYYNSRMQEFSDDGVVLNGTAYGYRWRHAWTLRRDMLRDGGGEVEAWLTSSKTPQVDQLGLLIDHLKAQPGSRRAVLEMWNVEDDLLGVNESKDVCCNLSVMFSLRQQSTSKRWDCRAGEPDNDLSGRLKTNLVLDMTVVSRSEDLVWGLLGTDYVDFTFLQEYVAARLGAGVGLYCHFVNNLHVYTSNWRPDEWLADDAGQGGAETIEQVYCRPGMRTVPLVSDPTVFESELLRFVELHSSAYRSRTLNSWCEPFLHDVAHPLLMAFHRRKDSLAVVDNQLRQVADDGWRLAATTWLKRRRAKTDAPTA